MNLDYSHNHDILAVCGNFADMRLIKGDLSHLMTKSFKLAKEKQQLQDNENGTK
jgi:hypothetical protein